MAADGTIIVSDAIDPGRLERLVSCNPAILYVADLKDGEPALTWISDNVTRILGYRPDETRGPGWWRDRLHPDDREWGPAWDQLKPGSGSVIRRYRFRHKDGAYRWLRDESRLDQTAGGLELSGSIVDITEFEDVGALVPSAHESVLDAIESFSEGFALFDADDRLVLVNGKWAEHYALVRDAFQIGAHFDEIQKILVASGKIVAARGREDEWVQERIAAHRDPGGRIERQIGDDTWLILTERRTRDGGTVVVSSDITELKRREAALRKSEERFRDLVEAMTDRIWETDSDHRFTYLSPAKSGLATDTLLGIRRWEIPGIDRDSAEWEQYRQMVAERCPIRGFRYRWHNDKGACRWVEISGTPFYDDESNFAGYRGTTTNVTEQKRAEMVVERREQEFRALLESAPEAMVVVGTDGTIVHVNTQAEALFGYSGGELVGTELERLVPTRHRDRHRGDRNAFIAKASTRPMGQGMELLARAKDGSEFPVEISLSAIETADRTLVAAAVRDITERKEREDALRKSEERYRSLILTLSDRVWETDAEDRITFLSPAKFGLPTEQLLGLRRWEIPGVDTDADEWKQYRLTVAARQPIRNFRYRWRNSAGESQWLEVGGTPIQDDDGNFAGYRGITNDVTAEVEAEARARSAQERLVAAIDRLAGPVSLYDAADRLVLANRAWWEFNGPAGDSLKVGITYEEYLRAAMAAGMYPESEGRDETWLRARIELHRHPQGPFELARQNGTWLYVDEHKLPDGGTITIATDITEHKRRAEELRISEERFKQLAHEFAGYVFETDVAHRFTYFSNDLPGGLKAEDAMGLRRWELPGVDPQAPCWQEYIADVEARRTIRKFRYERRYADGRVGQIQVDANPIFDGASTFLGYRGVINDITAELDADERARSAQERLGAAIDGMTGPVALYDAADRLVAANRSWWEFNSTADGDVAVGILYEDYLRSALAAGKFPEANGREDEWLRHRLEIHRNPDGPFELARENGRWIWVNEQRLPDGGVITVATDITARKKAEEEIRALNAELEGSVAERTRELTDELGVRRRVERELRGAKDAAEAGNQAKSQFLSMMSHELRTPLNAVLGFGQLLEQDPDRSLDESHRQCVAEILKAGQHLLKLISDILDFAQLEGRKIAISPRDIDPRPEIESCLTLLRPDADARGIEIVNRSVGRDLPEIFVDPTRFKQALLNLLSNAVKYNRDGGTVLVDAAATADGMLRVSVADTGPGISEQDRKRLFEPFNRLNVEATNVEGTGIGLSITKQLVELMHGRVGCDSQEGRGSTFWLDLPLSSANAGVRDQPAPSESGTTPGRESAAPRAVLYVEDDPANRRLMETVMTNRPGLALVCRETAEEALEFVSATPPDLILMDIGLPGMSGHEALAELRANGRTRDIPVIAVSAYAMPDDIDRGLEGGFDAYLTKPIHVGDLIEAIETALDTAPREAT